MPMVNKYLKNLSTENKDTEKPSNYSIQFLINYSKSIEHKKLKKKSVFLFQN
jgi:hypothetical protein